VLSLRKLAFGYASQPTQRVSQESLIRGPGDTVGCSTTTYLLLMRAFIQACHCIFHYIILRLIESWSMEDKQH